MAHGITSIDKGYVWGSTWHQHPNYVQVERAIEYAEAKSVLDFEVVKLPNHVWNPAENKYEVVEGSFTLVRMDTKTPLVADSVGDQFFVIPNVTMLENIDRTLLRPFKKEGLVIESVGTLWGGSLQFVSLVLEKNHVHGDESEHLSRLLYYNPLGRGSYRVCANDTRVVCANTMRMALLQGAANKTLQKFKHTPSSEERISKTLVDIAELKMGLKKHYEILNTLALQQMTSKDVKNFLSAFIADPNDDAHKNAFTRATNIREDIQGIFERQTGFTTDIRRSRYAMLNAITYFFDHEDLTRGNDEASRTWKGLVGTSASEKDRAMALLMSASFQKQA